VGEQIEITEAKVAVICAGDNKDEVWQLTCALLKAIGEWRGTVCPYDIVDACVSVIATTARALPTELLEDILGYTSSAMTTAGNALERRRGTN
jgi:hypothetical protein